MSGYRSCHSAELIGDDLYLWGGSQDLLPRVHDSEEKRAITSKVDVFTLSTLEWKNIATTGTPPAGVKNYATSVIGNQIYFIGGRCDSGSCCHNELYVLDTVAKAWSSIPLTNGPIEKSSCQLISYCLQGSNYLLTLGGFGKKIHHQEGLQHSSYVFHSGGHWTNEIHMLDLIAPNDKWRVPHVKGQRPPPLAYYTLDVLPHDKSCAVLFGGWIVQTCTDGHINQYTSNELYTLALSKDTVAFTKLCPKTHSVSEWPEPRRSHSSTILTSFTDKEESHLLVMGGQDDNWTTLADCWIMNITTKRWTKIDIPQSVCGRYSHSISSVTVRTNTQWLIVTGGLRMVSTQVTGPDVTVIVELEYRNGGWSATNVWNYEILVENKKDIQQRLVHHVIEDRLQRGTFTMTELIINLRNTVEVPVKNTSTTCELEQMLKEKKEEVEALQSEIAKLDALMKTKNEEIEQLKGVGREMPEGVPKLTVPPVNSSRVEDEVDFTRCEYSPKVRLLDRGGSFNSCQVTGLDQVIKCIKDEINKKHPALRELFESDLQTVAGQLLAVSLITPNIAKNPSFDAIINGFLTGFAFLDTVEQVEERCRKFLGAFDNVGGSFVVAADSVKRQINISLKEKCVSFNI